MAPCYITGMGHFLPGDPVPNERIQEYLGHVHGEGLVKRKILHANGILQRHYALTNHQETTHTVYELAAEAAERCLERTNVSIDLLTAGTTNTPYTAPGIASFVHAELAKRSALNQAVAISSHCGICSSGVQALLHGYQSIVSEQSRGALCLGVDQPSAILNSHAFPSDLVRPEREEELRQSEWFMSVFLRFMLSDGAGACILAPEPDPEQPSFAIDWIYTRSFAHKAPLCMSLESKTNRLRQDVDVLTNYMGPLSQQVLEDALIHHDEALENYTMFLPHMSSYFFKRHVAQTLEKLSPKHPLPFWSNLHSAGNTGAASIYILLDAYCAEHSIQQGERFLLFVPESGQFNFMIISLTAVS